MDLGLLSNLDNERCACCERYMMDRVWKCNACYINICYSCGVMSKKILNVGPKCHYCAAANVDKMKKAVAITRRRLAAIETNAVAKYIAPKKWAGPAFEMDQVEQLLEEWGLPQEIAYRIMYYYNLNLKITDVSYCRLNRKLYLL